MAKLHEVIAVEASVNATAQNIRNETMRTFSDKSAHFLSEQTSVRFFDESEQHLNTDEFREMVDTVFAKLRYTMVSQTRAIDVLIQKEGTNQVAKGDIVIDGKKIVSDVPAIVLLRLESFFSDIRDVFRAIPTLQPGLSWEKDLDANASGHIYVSQHPSVSFRTKKIMKPVVLHEATKEHPAQVQAVTEDVPIARVEKRVWSGMLSSAEKSVLLERIDSLLRAIKQARMRANNADVVKRKIGKSLFDYIFGETDGGAVAETEE